MNLIVLVGMVLIIASVIAVFLHGRKQPRQRPKGSATAKQRKRFNRKVHPKAATSYPSRAPTRRVPQRPRSARPRPRGAGCSGAPSAQKPWSNHRGGPAVAPRWAAAIMRTACAPIS